MDVGSLSPNKLVAEGVVINDYHKEKRSAFIPYLDSCLTGLLPLQNKL